MEVLIDKISFKNTIIDKIHIKGDKKDIIDFFKEILLEKQNHYDYSPYIHNIPQKIPNEYTEWKNPFIYDNSPITCDNTKSM